MLCSPFSSMSQGSMYVAYTGHAPAKLVALDAETGAPQAGLDFPEV